MSVERRRNYADRGKPKYLSKSFFGVLLSISDPTWNALGLCPFLCGVEGGQTALELT